MKCILCIDDNNGIAKNGVIPWNISEDLKYFNIITTYRDNPCKKNIVLMGRKTWESIGNPLPDRLNIVLSQTKINNKDIITISNLNELDKYIDKSICEVFIIGGKYIYEHFINNKLVDEIYLTKINKNFDCDLKVDIDLKYYELSYSNNYNVIEKNTNQEINIIFNNYKKKQQKINHEEMQYLNIMNKIKNEGHYRQTRNAFTFSLFGTHMYFDLTNNNFPLLTTKKMAIKSIFKELIFFLTGQTDSKILENDKVMIWKGNTSEDFIKNKCNLPYREGDMGPMYGFQWRHFNAKYEGCENNYENKGIDQLVEIVDLLKNDRYSRRIVMTTYNPEQVKEGVLYPCHGLTVQFGIENEDLLCCHMYQRSGDWFLGVPFNIASYSFLVHILCMLTGLKPGKLYISMGDVHIYEQHLDAVNEQLKRTPNNFPKINFKKTINDISEIKNLTTDDFEFIDYEHHPQIKAEMIA
jgi:dihydrofolate reductase / thymidylate synthase